RRSAGRAAPLVAGVLPSPPLLELPQLASIITMTSATATAPPALRLRDPRTDPTFPPNGYKAGTLTGSSHDECDRRHSGSYRRNLRNRQRPCQSLVLVVALVFMVTRSLRSLSHRVGV